MSSPSLSSETLHASAVAIGGRAVLIGGRSGTGKSDLALRLIDRGAVLISDDYTYVHRVKGQALAGAPPNIAGRIEVRGVGIVEREAVADIPVALFVDLEGQPERLPRGEDRITIAGVAIPIVALDGHHASAPLKVEVALQLFGLPAG
jgi:serine kinase of HPr protein (carbohydrate metabolism regulator)